MEDEISVHSRGSRSSSSSSAHGGRDSSTSPERSVRGRGRGRGRRPRVPRRPRNVGERGGGRGRGRARGNQRDQGPSRVDIVNQRREERKTRLRGEVEEMSHEDLKDLVLKMCDKDPALILDIVDSNSQREMRGYHPRPDSECPSWCVCGKCREMPTEEERVCCGQTPQRCISTVPDFDIIVLDPLVLVVARRYRQDILAAGEEDDHNKRNRHAAYRQYILWIHGHLGAGNRRVIPSCCVWKIRDQYPDSFGNYRGFIGGRLG